jgi:hypothetical protein
LKAGKAPLLDLLSLREVTPKDVSVPPPLAKVGQLELPLLRRTP